LLPFLVWTSRDYGATWDEQARDGYGRRVLEYWSGRRPLSDFKADSSRWYGGLFDMTAVLAQGQINAGRFVVRHRVNAVFGWLGIAVTTLVARRLFGSWAGLLALLLLALSPRYFADAMNNPKDLPFAALSMVTVYYLTNIRRTWPYLTWADAVKLGLRSHCP
jgi:4-amino-4-deoxy-L-arabinose transferase-like glycosyltransferase